MDVLTLLLLGFGLTWGLVQSRWQEVNQSLYRLVRRLIASGAILTGCYWLVATT